MKNKSILICGDVMLDRYWFGEVNRISPEAPVPIVRIVKTEERLGGAGNVASNCSSLSSDVVLLTALGQDDAGSRVEQLLEAASIRPVIHFDKALDTIVKLRVIGHQQQLLRIDFEKAPSNEVLSSKLLDFYKLVPTSDLVVLSDYGKGGLTHAASMIASAREHAKPVLVDPKGSDWRKYAGATLITPNRTELQEIVGGWSSEEELTSKAFALKEQLGLHALLVTRSEEGMTLFSDVRHHEPTVAKEVFDVSGAGDTVIATLAVMMARGETLVDAVRAANIAAGIVVAKLGTATVTQAELTKAMQG
jgi:D-glycero-beta-D-manno-heptose-7-phosphate kinase